MVIGYAILVAQCSDNHQIRTIDENGKRAPVLLEHVDDAISQRQELPVLLDAWAAACGRNADQPMLVTQLPPLVAHRARRFGLHPLCTKSSAQWGR